MAWIQTAKVQTLTVQDLAKAWLLDGVARKDGNAELQRRFSKDLYPALGKTAVNNVSEHDIRALICTVVNRGAHRQAISFFADLTQMMTIRWSLPTARTVTGHRMTCVARARP